jgi:cytochrome c2
LGAQTIFRVRVEDDRVMFAEPITIGHRIRDIAEANDGAIVMKTDDDFLIYLRPLDASTAATPLERGTILGAQCQGCHTTGAEGGVRIGPPLWKVVGRDIASEGGFNYSEALRKANGRWSEQSLKAFVQDPNSFAPGTAMLLGRKYTEAEAADIVAYLQTLK